LTEGEETPNLGRTNSFHSSSSSRKSFAFSQSELREGEDRQSAHDAIQQAASQANSEGENENGLLVHSTGETTTNSHPEWVDGHARRQHAEEGLAEDQTVPEEGKHV